MKRCSPNQRLFGFPADREHTIDLRTGLRGNEDRDLFAFSAAGDVAVVPALKKQSSSLATETYHRHEGWREGNPPSAVRQNARELVLAPNLPYFWARPVVVTEIYLKFRKPHPASLHAVWKEPLSSVVVLTIHCIHPALRPNIPFEIKLGPFCRRLVLP